jgi:hypothetical protein
MFRQALNTLQRVTQDPEITFRVLFRLGNQLSPAARHQTPAAFSMPVYRIIAEETGVPDPYAKEKRETNEAALALLPAIRSILEACEDPLDGALHAAVAGNIIDMGIGHRFDIGRDILPLLRKPFAVNAIQEFRSELRPGRRLLYLGDNAGEIVFDQLLVETLQANGVEVTYVVKSGPIINDATMDDAVSTGMTRVCRVIETGSNDIGVNWNHVSAEFRQAVSQSDVILGKGHGNFETCVGEAGNFYFLLKAKCPVVATAAGCACGDIVFKHTGSPSAHGSTE